MHPSESKQQLRESIIERLAHMSEKDRADESRSICRRLKENIPEGSGVCVYSALKKTEPDLTMLIEKLLKRHFTSPELRGLLLQIWEKRDDYHHLNPNITTDRKDLEFLAKEKLNILNHVER
ncbi:hypothetical protein KKF03_04255, partial [Patescibacteria group bacterium]|nr:hypothetical protein [Patescibacteria group bacterium]